MAYVAGCCPNCGGKIQLDESKERGFCLHCGSPIQVQEAVAKLKVELGGKVAVDGLNTIQQLKANAQRSFDVRQYENAIRDWRKATDIDSTDYESYWGQVRCWMAQHPTYKISALHDYDTCCLSLKSALAYAPAHIRSEYEAETKKHDANTEKVAQQIVVNERREQEEKRRHWKEIERFNHPRSVGLGVFFLLMGLGCLGGVITYIYVGEMLALIVISTIQIIFLALAVHFFKKPKK